MKKFLLVAFLITLFVLVFTSYLEYQASYGHGDAGAPVTFELTAGVGVLELGKQLEEKGIISSQYAFAWEVATKKLSRKLIAGEYELDPQSSIQFILASFTAGKVVSHDIKVTFPEGFTIDLMAKRLQDKGLPGEAFEKLAMEPDADLRAKYPFLEDVPQGMPLEGFLFPDTYHFRPEADAREIVEAMLENFDTRISNQLVADATRTHKSFYDALIVASIVEEEGNNKENRGYIAGIFWNRLAINQPLQSDVTVNYASGIHKQKLYLQDIDIDSKYNTYKYAGLPPTPITNPGLESITASVYPTSSDYLYFITDPKNGQAYYAKTFDEHVKNRQDRGL